MDYRERQSPFGGLFDLIPAPPALMAGAALLVMAAARAMVTASLMASVRAGNSVALFGLVTMGFNLANFLLFSAIYYVLARQLGDPEGAPRSPSIGPWIGLTITYGFITNVIAGLAPIIIFRNGGGALAATYPIIITGIYFAMRLVFFPLVTFLIALAHSGSEVSFGRITGFLFGKGIVWTVANAVLTFFVLVLPYGISYSLRGFTAPGGNTGMLINATIGALGQWLLILLTIAAYRAVRGSTRHDGDIFS